MRLIAYRAITPETGSTIFIHRICGLPGNTVELRAGILYINGANADKNLNLKHIYKLSPNDAAYIKYDPDEAYTIDPYPDTVYASLTDTTVRSNQWTCTQYILPPGLRDNAIFAVYKKNWNPDNFGPIKVPPGKYFVLGDNRAHSMDSRYHGFVDAKKFLGCVLWK